MGALVGETVGSYRITDVLGQGGMGVVYRAEHVLLGKRAAVKVLLPERCTSREMVDRFFNEAKSATLVEDPGIVDIFDYGRMPDGNAYIVMELLEGETLGDRLKRVDRLPSGDAALVTRHIAGTLAAAHGHGIIHRDLKPDNVFMVKDSALPGGERAKLLDFGIAKLASGSQPADMVKTETGRLMGTPYYMSPEQCRGAGKIDHRTDIYSLGCVLYQMLTGRPPFVLEGPGEILAAHIHVPPMPPRQYEASIPTSLQAVVLRMLQKEPVRRYQSASDLVSALQLTQRRSGAEDAEPGFYDSGRHRAMNRTSSSQRVFTSGTTVDSTAGDLSRDSRLDLDGSRRGRTMFRLVAGASIAAGVAALLLIGGDDEDARRSEPPESAGAGARIEPPPAAAPTAAGEPTADEPTAGEAAPPRDPTAIPQPPPPAEETVQLRVSSHPEGATVYRESDGVRLGKTPIEVAARRGRGEAVFILRRTGYRAERLAVPVDKDQERLIALRPQRPSMPPSRTRAIPAPVPGGAKAAPADGKAAPADGSAAPADDSTAPAPAETTPAEGKSAPAPGDDGGGASQPAPAPADPGAASDAAPASGDKPRGKDDALDPFPLRHKPADDSEKKEDRSP